MCCCLCLMLAASFIDIDEKIIPDEITLPGTLARTRARRRAADVVAPATRRPAGTAAAGSSPVAVADNQRVVSRAGHGRRAEPLAAGMGCRRQLAVAGDRARLLLALVLRTHAADLARPPRSHFRTCD